MPLYYGLRPRRYDGDETKAEKKRTVDRLLELRLALRDHLHGGDDPPSVGPERDSAKYLRLATWNIREFDSGKFGERLRESLYYIAEILSHMDLIAVQEVREDRQALDRVMSILGPGWTYIATDVTEGIPGNRERMAFVYDTRKVWFRKIAGEVMLPKGERIEYPYEERLRFSQGLSLDLPDGTALESPPGVETYRRSGKERLDSELHIELPEGTQLQLPEGSTLVLPHRHVVTLTDEERVVLPEGTEVRLPKELMIKLPPKSIVGDLLQFARSPFLVSFQAGWLKLNLCTVHIYYGEGKAGLARRNQEIRKLTKFLADRASSDNDSDADSFFIALGDFNIVGKDHATMASLKTNGFTVPPELQTLPGTNVKQDKLYDQIAYWTHPSEDAPRPNRVTRVEVERAGVFDFFGTLFRMGDDDPGGEDEALYASYMEPGEEYWEWRTYQMSDHLPMWVELRIDFGDEYLQSLGEEE
jgi:hypothetical protein